MINNARCAIRPSMPVVVWCRNKMINNKRTLRGVRLLVVVWCRNKMINNRQWRRDVLRRVVVWCRNKMINNNLCKINWRETVVVWCRNKMINNARGFHNNVVQVVVWCRSKMINNRRVPSMSMTNASIAPTRNCQSSLSDRRWPSRTAAASHNQKHTSRYSRTWLKATAPCWKRRISTHPKRGYPFTFLAL